MFSFFASKKSYTCSTLSKLIDFNENQLIKINNINIPKKELIIISFLGPARIGKSTLLNCFLSFILNENFKKFNTSSTSKGHITMGVDMVYLESDTKTIILLDVQGLDFQDSSNDCKLMLFVYMISNIIIYNERGFLTNKVLSSLQSLTCLLTFIDKNNDFNKPELIFRTSDIDDESDFDSIENLNDLLSDTKHDQYTNTRKSIKKLFSNIKSFPTFILDKFEKKIIDKENNYFKFLDQENNFKDFCSKIFNIINTKSNNPIINNIDTIIEQINSNQNIDFKIFDLTYSQALLSIKTWEDSIDYSKLSISVIDGTQGNYDTYIQPIIDYYTSVMKEYDLKFKLTTPEIKLEQEKRIRSKFDNFINKAITESELKSNNIMKSWLERIKHDFIFTIKFDKLADVILAQLNNNYILLKDNIYTINCLTSTINTQLDYFKSRKIELKDKITELYNDFIEKENLIINDEIDLINEFIILETEQLMDDTTKITIHFDTLIENIVTRFIKQNIETWKNKYIKKEYNLLTGFIKDFIDPSNDHRQYYSLLDKICNKINKDKLLNHIFSNDTFGTFGINVNNSKTSICEYIKSYFDKKQDEFEDKRKEILQDELNEIQEHKELDYDYIKILKHYEEIKKLYDELISAGNNVKFLDILGTIIEYFKYMNKKNINIECEKHRILSRYVFIVNNLDMHYINIESEFNELYNDILVFYNHKFENDLMINYECVSKIIDILFTRAITL